APGGSRPAPASKPSERTWDSSRPVRFGGGFRPPRQIEDRSMRIFPHLRLSSGGVLIVGLAMGTAGPAWAQNTGSVAGTVTDAASGQPVGDVRVHVARTTLQGVTDLHGLYRISNVPAGAVTLEVRR